MAKLTWVRIGLGINQTGEYRPLFGIGISGDGGIFLKSFAELATEGWNYGHHYLPSKRSKRKRLNILSGNEIFSEDEPKMHFHKSGAVTVKRENGVTSPRTSELTRINRFKGQQCFSVTVDRPDLVQATFMKKNDVAVFDDEHPSTALAVGIFLLPSRKALRKGISIEPADSSIGLLPDANGEHVVINLAERGLDILVAFRFQRFESPNKGNDAKPTIRATAMDGKFFKYRQRKTVSMWSKNHLNPAIFIGTKANSPFHNKFDSKVHKRDVRRFTRSMGNPPTEI